jgi:hypothetical protein
MLFGLGRVSKESFQVRGPLWYFVTSFFKMKSFSPTPNPQTGEPPLFACPWLLIQYINYTAYLEAFSSICNLRTRHAMVKKDP